MEVRLVAGMMRLLTGLSKRFSGLEVKPDPSHAKTSGLTAVVRTSSQFLVPKVTTLMFVSRTQRQRPMLRLHAKVRFALRMSLLKRRSGAMLRWQALKELCLCHL